MCKDEVHKYKFKDNQFFIYVRKRNLIRQVKNS